MGTSDWAREATKGVSVISDVTAWAGMLILSGITLLIFVDVSLRYFLNKPLLGTIELVQQSMAALSGIVIMYCSAKAGHISVDFLYNRFPKGIQMIMQRVISFLGFGSLCIITYVVFKDAVESLKLDTSLLMYPSVHTAPFEIILTVGLFMSCLATLIQVWRPPTSVTSDVS